MPEFPHGSQYVDSPAMDAECRRYAEEIYTRVRGRDFTRSQAEIEALIADIKGAVLVWMGAGCNVLAATAGFNVGAGVTIQPTPVTFVASPGAPLNTNL